MEPDWAPDVSAGNGSAQSDQSTNLNHSNNLSSSFSLDVQSIMSCPPQGYLKPRIRLLSTHVLKAELILSPNLLQMDRKHLHFVNEVSRGWFGPVIAGECTKYGETLRSSVFVRMLCDDMSTAANKLLFLADIQSYKECVDPCILKLIGLCTDTEPYYVVMEHACVDLKNYLRTVPEFPVTVDSKVRLKFVCQASRGLSVLHEKGFVYQDMGARNCWLTDQFNLKLGDYGNSQILHSEDYVELPDVVPLRWMAPELVTVGKHGSLLVADATLTSNFWSLGVLISEVSSFAQLPYYELANDALIDEITKCGAASVLSMDRIGLFDKTSNKYDEDEELNEQLHSFARQLLVADPTKRTSAADITSSAELLFRPHSHNLQSCLEESWSEYRRTISGSMQFLNSMDYNPVLT